jgi:hypothetical protein
MDQIDITDSNFSLNNVNNLVSNNAIMDYTNPLWIYIGVFVFFIFAGLIFYKYYQSKKNTYNQVEQPCCNEEIYNENNKDNRDYTDDES